MEYEIYKVDDELCHHGIRGMRWGIRRYQNKDGSLTPRGKKRYDAELKKVRAEEKVLKNRQATRAKIEKLEARKQAAAAEKDALDAADGKKKRKLFGRKEKAEKEVKKSIKDMTDVELYEAINRARMEDTYRQLRPEKVNKPNPFGQMLNDVVKPAATNAGRQFLENALKKAGAKLLEDKVDPDSIEALELVRKKMEARTAAAKAEKEYERIKSGEPEEKSAKDRLVEVQYEKAKRELDNLRAADAKAEADAKADAAVKAAERRKAYRTVMTVSNKANKSAVRLDPDEIEFASSSGRTFVDKHSDTMSTPSSSAQDRGRSFVSANGDVLFTWSDD